MGVVVESVHALTNGVPDLDGLVSTGRNNLSVVVGERNRQNILGVTNKSLNGVTSLQVPQSEGLIPRSRDGIGTVLGDGNVLDNVGVTVKGSLGDTVSLVVSGQVPNNQSLVSGSRQKDVGVVSGSSKGGNPAR